MSSESVRISTSFTTKERLLDAAQELFANRGISATSLRDITSKAGTNLASVNYHYGSKENLIRAVFERYLAPLNRSRHQLFDELQARMDRGESASIRGLLYALTAPCLRLWYENPDFMRLAGRLHTDPNDELRHEVLINQFSEIADRMSRISAVLLPKLSPSAVFWRMHFSLGAMLHAITNARDSFVLSRGTMQELDFRGLLEELISYCAAGLLAPPCNSSGCRYDGLEAMFSLPTARIDLSSISPGPDVVTRT